MSARIAVTPDEFRNLIALLRRAVKTGAAQLSAFEQECLSLDPLKFIARDADDATLGLLLSAMFKLPQ